MIRTREKITVDKINTLIFCFLLQFFLESLPEKEVTCPNLWLPPKVLVLQATIGAAKQLLVLPATIGAAECCLAGQTLNCLPKIILQPPNLKDLDLPSQRVVPKLLCKPNDGSNSTRISRQHEKMMFQFVRYCFMIFQIHLNQINFIYTRDQFLNIYCLLVFLDGYKICNCCIPNELSFLMSHQLLLNVLVDNFHYSIRQDDQIIGFVTPKSCVVSVSPIQYHSSNIEELQVKIHTIVWVDQILFVSWH